MNALIAFFLHLLFNRQGQMTRTRVKWLVNYSY